MKTYTARYEYTFRMIPATRLRFTRICVAYNNALEIGRRTLKTLVIDDSLWSLENMELEQEEK